MPAGRRSSLTTSSPAGPGLRRRKIRRWCSTPIAPRCGLTRWRFIKTTISVSRSPMPEPIKIRMGGYGPPTTSFSRSLKLIGDLLSARFGDGISVDCVWNIMDHGHRAEDILTLVENGEMPLGYHSSSFLADRGVELRFVDLPFLYERREEARAAIDGTLGQSLSRSI